MALKEFIFSTDLTQIGISFGNDYVIEPTHENCLDNLRKLNIIVGANNSGKSRILRAIFRQDGILNKEFRDKFINFFNEFKELINSNRHAIGQFRNTELFFNHCSDLSGKKFWTASEYIKLLNESIGEITHFLSSNSNFFIINHAPDFPAKIQGFLSLSSELIESFQDEVKLKVEKLYIPTLRGLRTLQEVESDLYSKRTIKDYFKEGNVNDTNEIFTGQLIYRDITEKLLGGRKDRDFIKKYESFLSSKFFSGKSVTLVPRQRNNSGEVSDVIYVTFDDHEEKERSIDQYGDGLQSIICITYPIFLWLNIKKKVPEQLLLVCIEEPELYLHPSMQRKLVEVLLSEDFESVQYFVTSHSNHFLDLSQESEYNELVSIYSCNITQDELKILKNENELTHAVYELLGVRTSSVLLANKTIWVEGVSDRIYIRHGLKLFFEKEGAKKIPSEDLDYAFVEFGGGNLSHYISEEDDLDINSLSNCHNVFLIVDNDGVKFEVEKLSKKSLRYLDLKKQIEELNGKFFITKGREIENYISPSILRCIYPELSVELTHDNYFNKELPKFLKKKGCAKYITKNKRWSNKKNLAEKVVLEQKDWEDLSSEMQVLIKDIVDFIR